MKTALSIWRGVIPVRVPMRDILSFVGDQYGYSIDELRGPLKTKEISHARQHAMWLMAQQQHLSLPQIGRYLGGRDHTTVIYGIRAHLARMEAACGEQVAA